MDKLYSGRVIERSEYRTIMPVSDLNFNTPNNYTTFKLDNADAFYDSGMMYYIQGKVVKKSDGTDFADKSTIKLINNFVPFLFSRIELRKHNTLIDSVDHPGITSTVKGMVSYSSNQKNTLNSNGFKSSFVGGGAFEALGTLSHLGLGFFDHMRHPMYKGGFEITFTRAEDNDALLHWKGTETGATDPGEGKVVITSFVLLAPLVDYEANARTELILGLNKLSEKDELTYRYFQWQCMDKKGVFGSSFTFDISNLYRNVNNPQFAIVGLQTNRTNDQTKNPSEFDECNIKNVSVTVNGIRYPAELQNLNIRNQIYRKLYDQYLAFRKIVFHDTDVILTAEEFIKKWPLMVIDTHYHPGTVSSTRNSIQVELDFTNPIASPEANVGTTAYVVLVSRNEFKYDLFKNIIRMA